MSTPAKPLPDVHDPVYAPYWAATRAGTLVVPRCDHCRNRLWPPEPVCPSCLHTTFTWECVEPEGTLWSFAVYHRALDPAFADEIPYAVGLIELAGGEKMYGLMRGELADLTVDARVRAVFEPATEDVTFVRWQVEK